MSHAVRLYKPGGEVRSDSMIDLFVRLVRYGSDTHPLTLSPNLSKKLRRWIYVSQIEKY